MVATGVYLSIRNTDLFLSLKKHSYHIRSIVASAPSPLTKNVFKSSLYIALCQGAHAPYSRWYPNLIPVFFSWGYVKEKLYTPSLQECVVELQHRYTKNCIDRPTNCFTAWFVSYQKTRFYKNGDINEVADLHFLSCPFRILNSIARESSENGENNLETLSKATPSFSKFKYK